MIYKIKQKHTNHTTINTTIKMEPKHMKECDKWNGHIRSKICMIYIVSNNGRHPLTETSNTLHPTTLHSTSLHLSTLHFLPFKLQTNIILGPVGTGSEPHHSHRSTADVPNARILFNDPHVKWCFMNTRKEISLYSLTFRHRASCI